MYKILIAALLAMCCSFPALADEAKLPAQAAPDYQSGQASRDALVGAVPGKLPARDAQVNAAPARLPAQEALTRLKEGNARFVKGYMTTFPFADLRKNTAQDQYPMAMVLSCADSRVVPEYIFNQALGDLFVARVAGNTQSAGITGTLEYGAVKMGLPLLVVLGHSDCEAVGLMADKSETGGNIAALLAPIAPAVARGAQLAGNGDAALVLNKSISENVGQSMEDLFRASPAIRKLVREKNLMVVGALYNVESGEVRWLGPHPSEQALIAD